MLRAKFLKKMTGQIFEQRSQKRDNRKNVFYHTKFMGQDKAYSIILENGKSLLSDQKVEKREERDEREEG